MPLSHPDTKICVLLNSQLNHNIHISSCTEVLLRIVSTIFVSKFEEGSFLIMKLNGQKLVLRAQKNYLGKEKKDQYWWNHKCSDNGTM